MKPRQDWLRDPIGAILYRVSLNGMATIVLLIACILDRLGFWEDLQ